MMVALALPILIGLGLWQVSRMHWKEAVLAQMQAAATLPPLALETGPIPADAAFRKADVRLICRDQLPLGEAARNAAGESGWATVLTCTTPDGEQLHLVLGWSSRSDGWTKLTGRWTGEAAQTHSGTLVPGLKTRFRLYASDSPPPLVPAQPPTPESLPNNHRFYAIQWFAFAGILLVIYGLWLRRWVAQRSRPA